MSVKVFVSASQITIPMDEPVIFPESPLIGDSIDFMSMIPYQSEERREMILKLQEMRLSGYGTVIDRYWGCKNVGEEPLLFITIDLLSKP